MAGPDQINTSPFTQGGSTGNDIPPPLPGYDQFHDQVDHKLLEKHNAYDGAHVSALFMIYIVLSGCVKL